MVKILLENGANVTQPDHAGLLAVEHVRVTERTMKRDKNGKLDKGHEPIRQTLEHLIKATLATALCQGHLVMIRADESEKKLVYAVLFNDRLCFFADKETLRSEPSKPHVSMHEVHSVSRLADLQAAIGKMRPSTSKDFSTKMQLTVITSAVKKRQRRIKQASISKQLKHSSSMADFKELIQNQTLMAEDGTAMEDYRGEPFVLLMHDDDLHRFRAANETPWLESLSALHNELRKTRKSSRWTSIATPGTPKARSSSNVVKGFKGISQGFKWAQRFGISKMDLTRNSASEPSLEQTRAGKAVGRSFDDRSSPRVSIEDQEVVHLEFSNGLTTTAKIDLSTFGQWLVLFNQPQTIANKWSVARNTLSDNNKQQGLIIDVKLQRGFRMVTVHSIMQVRNFTMCDLECRSTGNKDAEPFIVDSGQQSSLPVELTQLGSDASTWALKLRPRNTDQDCDAATTGVEFEAAFLLRWTPGVSLLVCKPKQNAATCVPWMA